jgi:hypothetical protein
MTKLIVGFRNFANVPESDTAITSSGALIKISNPSEKLIKKLRENFTLFDVLAKSFAIF